jgi:hypothetical protein
MPFMMATYSDFQLPEVRGRGTAVPKPLPLVYSTRVENRYKSTTITDYLFLVKGKNAGKSSTFWEICHR